MASGARQLEARLNAMAAPAMRRAVLGRLGLLVVKYAKEGVARKTGTTGRSIHLEEVSDDHARVVAAGAAPFLESGTGLYGPRHRKIVPVRAKALRWAVGPSGSLTLAGRPRSGKKGAGAGYIFRRSVKGMKAQPFMKPAAEQAIRESGAAVTIIQTWNGAA